MTAIYPIHDTNNIIENVSIQYLLSRLPRTWLSERPRNDFGIDLRIEIVNGNNNRGREILIQMKSAKEEKGNEIRSDFVKCSGFKVSTYNYLKEKLQVVIIIKYIVDLNEAYWIKLLDVPVPNQRKKTFTINIPKENRISTIDWREIEEYVNMITDRKLEYANR